MRCLTPYYVTLTAPNYNPITKEWDSEVPTPCGKCPNCIERRIREWTFRLEQHNKSAITAYFCTFTYDQNKIPWYNDETGPVLHLKKKHIQLFFKRLRSHDIRRKTPTFTEGLLASKKGKILTSTDRLERPPIKMLTIGEYGGQTKRPHYHSIIYNTFPAHIEKAWDKGNVHIGVAGSGSLHYVMSYLNNDQGRFNDNSNDPRNEKQFQISSKHLGYNYLFNDDGTPSTMHGWHKRCPTQRNYGRLYNGTIIPLPKYYQDQLWTDEEKLYIRQHIHNEIHELENKRYYKYLNSGGVDKINYHMQRSIYNNFEFKRKKRIKL